MSDARKVILFDSEISGLFETPESFGDALHVSDDGSQVLDDGSNSSKPGSKDYDPFKTHDKLIKVGRENDELQRQINKLQKELRDAHESIKKLNRQIQTLTDEKDLWKSEVNKPFLQAEALSSAGNDARTAASQKQHQEAMDSLKTKNAALEKSNKELAAENATHLATIRLKTDEQSRIVKSLDETTELLKNASTELSAKKNESLKLSLALFEKMQAFDAKQQALDEKTQALDAANKKSKADQEFNDHISRIRDNGFDKPKQSQDPQAYKDACDAYHIAMCILEKLIATCPSDSDVYTADQKAILNTAKQFIDAVQAERNKTQHPVKINQLTESLLSITDIVNDVIYPATFRKGNNQFIVDPDKVERAYQAARQHESRLFNASMIVIGAVIAIAGIAILGLAALTLPVTAGLSLPFGITLGHAAVSLGVSIALGAGGAGLTASSGLFFNQVRRNPVSVKAGQIVEQTQQAAQRVRS